MPQINQNIDLVIFNFLAHHLYRKIRTYPYACWLKLFHNFHIFHYVNNYANYKNKNWPQFLFIVKAAVLKQQISKFYPQILSKEDSVYIYDRPLTEINVIASFCALKLRIKF